MIRERLAVDDDDSKLKKSLEIKEKGKLTEMDSSSEGRNADTVIQKLKSALNTRPGKSLPEALAHSEIPKAAVAVVLKPSTVKGELLVLLVKRKTREGDPWSGHMAFPGGRYSQEDTDLVATVFREVKEETAIDLRNSTILGMLDEVLPRNFSVRVTPYVVLCQEETSVKIDPREIDDFVWIPLSFFIDRKNLRLHTVPSDGSLLEVPSYRFVEDQVIWGMTFRIIEDFVSKIS